MSAQEADHLMTQTLIPMIGDRQKAYEARMEQIVVSVYYI